MSRSVVLNGKDEELKLLMELYKQGLTYDDIAERIHRTGNYVNNYVKALIEIEALEPREKRVTHKRRVDYEKKSAPKKEKPKVVTRKGKVCDWKFCKTCVYHCTEPVKHFCNYAEITGKTRVNQDNNADKGNMWECRVYQKIDDKHPLLHTKYYEVLNDKPLL